MLLAGFLVILLTDPFTSLPRASAIVQECQACRQISKELMKRLASEKHRDPINLKYRLDSQGKKYGKIIEFRLSEQRIHDLLDDLCTAASADATLYRVKNDDQYSLVWNDVKESDSWIAPDKAEKEGRKKELENYCVRLLDEHEDELTGILKEDSGDLEGILCERLAKACEPKTENPENARSEL
ncbi:g8118 [Coccomyxa elongata]